MADATYQPLVYRKQGGASLVIASGGTIAPETGHAIQPAPAVLGTDNAKGVYISSPNSSSSFFANTANAKRSYLLRIEAYRPSTLPMGDGVSGVDDAAIYAIYRSYAADAAYTIQRGANINARHSGTSVGTVHGASIGTNIGTSTVVAADVIVAVLNNENYGVSTGGVSGVLDLLHTHEGANATDTEFGLRIRNAKKNGSQTGAFVRIQNDTSATTFLKYGVDISGAAAAAGGVSTLKGDVVLGTKDANGLPAIIASGAATSDATIVTQVGADTLWADGSLYISVLDGAGTLWQKRNDVWTSI